MSNLVDRTYKVTAHPQPSGFVADNPNFFEEVGNAIEVFALRVQFQVEKHLLKDPNTAELTISNLSEHTRTQFQTRPLRVEIAAGYQGVNKLLFVGDVRPGSGSKLLGTEWETKLLLGDGSRAFAHGRVSRSYKGGTPVKNIIRDAARALGLSLPTELENDTQLQA